MPPKAITKGSKYDDNKTADKQPTQQKQPASDRDQIALINYIQKARTKGLTDDQITQNLLSNGWTEASVASAPALA